MNTKWNGNDKGGEIMAITVGDYIKSLQAYPEDMPMITEWNDYNGDNFIKVMERIEGELLEIENSVEMLKDVHEKYLGRIIKSRQVQKVKGLKINVY